MSATSPTLVFTSGSDPFQLLVSAVSLSPASHAAIGLGDHLLHVHEKGVVYEPRFDWFAHKRQRLVAEFEILPDVQRGLAIAFSCLGDRYDYGGVARLGLHLMLCAAFSPLQGHLGSPPCNAHTCAAFVMLLDPDSSRIPEWDHLNRSTVLPVDLLRAALNGPSFSRSATPIKLL